MECRWHQAIMVLAGGNLHNSTERHIDMLEVEAGSVFSHLWLGGVFVATGIPSGRQKNEIV